MLHAAHAALILPVAHAAQTSFTAHVAFMLHAVHAALILPVVHAAQTSFTAHVALMLHAAHAALILPVVHAVQTSSTANVALMLPAAHVTHAARTSYAAQAATYPNQNPGLVAHKELSRRAQSSAPRSLAGFGKFCQTAGLFGLLVYSGFCHFCTARDRGAGRSPDLQHCWQLVMPAVPGTSDGLAFATNSSLLAAPW
eukprot:gene16539-22767_t